MSSFMKRSKNFSLVSVVVFAVLAFSLSFFSDGIASTSIAALSVKKTLDENYGKLPLYFVKNEGQVDERISFFEKGNGHTTLLTSTAAYLLLNSTAGSDGEVSKTGSLKLGFINANSSPVITADGLQGAQFNYFIGSEENWKTNVPSYASVLYKGIYDGIDLKFYGNGSELEYDVIVSPGVDPSVVRFSLEGTEGVSINSRGDLELKLSGGSIIQNRPIIYQEIDGRRVDIDGSFALESSEGGYAYGFNIASYDKSHTLIIDPIVITYSTYLGGAGNEAVRGLAVDSSGYAYVTGETTSTNFDLLNNLYTYGVGTMAFITKVNQGGTNLVFSTYLGGGANDNGMDVALDSSNNIYLTGYTLSTNFPTTIGSYQSSKFGAASNVYVTKLNAAGSALVYSTYIGATSGAVQNDRGYAIKVDSSGNAYVAGRAASQSFPATSGAYQTTKYGGSDGVNDSFMLKLNPSGTDLVYSTLLGHSGQDYLNGMNIDSAGNAYVTGNTLSASFPVVNAAQATYGGTGDAFVTKINPTGTALLFSTFLGGSANDGGNDIGVDSSGNVYVVGFTDSANFPVLNAHQSVKSTGRDGFVAKLNSSGVRQYTTFFGGIGTEEIRAVSVESDGFIITTGETSSTDFPTTVNAPDASFNGGIDAFISGFNPTGTLDISSFFGSTGTSTANEYGYDIVLRGNSVYIAGKATGSIPTVGDGGGVFQGGFLNDEAFVAKFTDNSPHIDVDPWSKDFGSIDIGAGPTSAQIFTLRNDGNQNLVVSAIALAGTDPTQFLLTKGDGSGGTCGSTPTVAPTTGSCTVSVVFDPSTAGAKSAKLSITSNDDFSPELIDLSGTGTAAAQFTLTVSKAGTGSGTVTSTPAGIDCGATCSAPYNQDTVVTLTAAVSTGSTFTGWTVPSGTCSGTTSPCTVTMAAARDVTATFTINTYGLTVTKAGTGAGTVTSTPAGISCGATCAFSFNYNTTVTLTSAASVGSTFAGWTVTSGTCTGTTSPCTVTLDQVRNVTATYTLSTYTLTVAKSGAGTGTVTGTGINCGGDCTEVMGYGTSVTLTATPDSAMTFNGWSGGGCSGVGTCVVTISGAVTVTADFIPGAKFALDVTKAGNGSGTVTSTPAGITCGVDCAENFDEGLTVTLTAAASTGSAFTGWTVTAGTCTGTTSPCTVTMSAARAVTATFTLNTFALTVSKAGAGAGLVTSTPAGISCGATCAFSFNYNTTVTLTSAASVGSTFAGWTVTSGTCSGTTSPCTVTLDQARNVTASYTVNKYTLTYTKAGTGGGTVVSSPAGINSASSTTFDFDYNTVVTLTATPSTGSTFTWSGTGGCTGSATCVMTMSQARAATATFTLIPYALTVSKAGTGVGTVTSTPAGISCGATCTFSFNYGTIVTLTSAASTGSTFTGWTVTAGTCSGTTSPCTVTVDQARAVTASYTLSTYALTVSKAGTGTGTVTSSNAAINCGATCSAQYNYNTTATLTAAATSGMTFAGWTVTSGTCTGTTNPCSPAVMTAARAVTATFNDPALTDSDGDGIPDSQDSSPTNNKIASPAAPTGSGNITVSIPSGNLTLVSAVNDDDDSLDQTNRPAGVSFPHGIVKFTANGVGNGATIVVTLTFPETLPDGTVYYKVTGAGFAVFPGAVINGNLVTLTLTDGGAGDGDNTVNGIIVDPGGPGAPAVSGPVANYGGSSSGCFIATAAYGSYQEPHVWILRQFRDKILLTNKAGEAFVKLYYRTSPPLADYISKHDGLRAATRTALLPLYGFAQLTLALGPAGSMIFFGMIFTLGVTGVVIRRRRRE